MEGFPIDESFVDDGPLVCSVHQDYNTLLEEDHFAIAPDILDIGFVDQCEEQSLNDAGQLLPMALYDPSTAANIIGPGYDNSLVLHTNDAGQPLPLGFGESPFVSGHQLFIEPLQDLTANGAGVQCSSLVPAASQHSLGMVSQQQPSISNYTFPWDPQQYNHGGVLFDTWLAQSLQQPRHTFPLQQSSILNQQSPLHPQQNNNGSFILDAALNHSHQWNSFEDSESSTGPGSALGVAHYQQAPSTAPLGYHVSSLESEDAGHFLLPQSLPDEIQSAVPAASFNDQMPSHGGLTSTGLALQPTDTAQSLVIPSHPPCLHLPGVKKPCSTNLHIPIGQQSDLRLVFSVSNGPYYLSWPITSLDHHRG